MKRKSYFRAEAQRRGEEGRRYSPAAAQPRGVRKKSKLTGLTGLQGSKNHVYPVNPVDLLSLQRRTSNVER
jgi:hypothetical protein